MTKKLDPVFKKLEEESIKFEIEFYNHILRCSICYKKYWEIRRHHGREYVSNNIRSK